MSKLYDQDTVLELLREEVGSRGRMYYFVYTVLKERNLDYKDIMKEVIERNVQDTIKDDKNLMDLIKSPDDLVEVFASDHELLGMSFNQEIIESNKDLGILRFNHCPYNKVWKDMNLDFKTRKELCEIELIDMKSFIDSFDEIELHHTSNCIESDYCELTIKRKTDE